MLTAFKPAGMQVDSRVVRLVNRMLGHLPQEWDAVTVYPRFAPSDKQPSDFVALVRVGTQVVTIVFDTHYLRDPALCANHLINAARHRLGTIHVPTDPEEPHGCTG